MSLDIEKDSGARSSSCRRVASRRGILSFRPTLCCDKSCHMHPARWVALTLVTASILFLAGMPAAQQPQPGEQRPAQPTPVPIPPPGPGTPTQPGPPGRQPAPPAKKEEPEAPLPPETAIQPTQRVPEDLLRSPVPTVVAPRVFVGPDLFNPPATQGWLTVTPSFTLSGEYNDNIDLSASPRRSDAIIGFAPGLTLSVQRPSYRILAGYNISGQLFVDHSNESDFGKEQNFFADVLYQISPRVTFTLSDTFVYSRDTNSVTSGGISAGRQNAWRNTLTPQLRWQATPNTGVNFFGSYTIIRFDKSTDENSDTYRAGVGVDYRFTQRLSGTASTEVGYLDVEGEKPATTVTPLLGLIYQITPTLSGYLSGGPTIVEREGEDTSILPSFRVGLGQLFKWGSLQAGYDRSVTAGTVGIVDQHSIFASLLVGTLVRGLQFSFTPRYTISNEDVSNSRGSNDTINTLSLNLNATYQIARNISLIGSYTFFHQTSDARGVGNIDQNRVFLGLQYAYPINFY